MNIPIHALKRFNQFAKAFFNTSKRNCQLPLFVEVYPSAEGAILFIKKGEQSISFKHSEVEQNGLCEPVTIPYEIFQLLCKGTSSLYLGPIRTGDHGSRFTLEWNIGAVKRSMELDLVSPENSLPTIQETFSIDNRLLKCLKHATQTTDETSVRYALNCLLLDGRSGTLSATDGVQLLQFSGLQFPWIEEAVLIRCSRLFTLMEFGKLKNIRLGIVGDTLHLTADQWNFAIPIERECRFPQLDPVIPSSANATNRVQISDLDRKAIQECVRQLPGDGQANQPVEFDLNGHVKLSGYPELGARRNVCLELERSVHIGNSFRVAVNRNHIIRAAELGATEILFFGKGSPALCRSDRLKFVWQPLETTDTPRAYESVQLLRTRQLLN